MSKKDKGLFDSPEPWQEHWVGMPEFVQGSQEPVQKIVVNFTSRDDVEAFGKLVGYTLTERSRSIWFPFRDRTNRKAFEYRDECDTPST